jgi:hypothetical protein
MCPTSNPASLAANTRQSICDLNHGRLPFEDSSESFKLGLQPNEQLQTIKMKGAIWL